MKVRLVEYNKHVPVGGGSLKHLYLFEDVYGVPIEFLYHEDQNLEVGLIYTMQFVEGKTVEEYNSNFKKKQEGAALENDNPCESADASAQCEDGREKPSDCY